MKKKSQNQRIKSLECWAKDFILYYLCNGETLKVFECGRENIKVCFTNLPATLGYTRKEDNWKKARCVLREWRGRERAQKYIIVAFLPLKDIILSRNVDSGPGQVLSLTCSGP